MRPLQFLIATFLIASPAALWAQTQPQTWAERLGYPADKRVVILYANYMGSAYEFNRPGQLLLESGQVQSAGLMVPCPWFEEFASWARQHPGHDIGVCLTLNSPGTAYRWRPLGGNEASSLLDADGYLWRSELQLAIRADADQVAEEIDRQIQRAKMAGVRPSHLIPFMGSMLARPDLTRLYLEVAERNWIPAVMVEMSPKNIEAFRRDGFPLTDEMIELIGNYPLPKLDELHFIPEAESYEAKREKFYDLIRNLPPGLTQIIAGPADDTAAIQQMTPRWQLRVWENQLLADEAVQKFLEDEGIVFSNWKEIMRRFETPAGQAPAQAEEPAEAADRT